MKMDTNIFIHFITIFYSTKSCNANAQRQVLFSLFIKLRPISYGLACGDYAGFKGMGMSELGQKSKPGERGEAYFSFVQGNPDITKSSV